jgi:hypothetical protein
MNTNANHLEPVEGSEDMWMTIPQHILVSEDWREGDPCVSAKGLSGEEGEVGNVLAAMIRMDLPSSRLLPMSVKRLSLWAMNRMGYRTDHMGDGRSWTI